MVSRDYNIAGYRLETKMLEFLSFDQLYMWKEGDGASKFEGNDLRLFTHNFVNLADWFREKSIIDVSGSNEWDSFLQALSIWPSINRFLIEQRADSDYEDRINEFEKEVELFYECGRNLFLVGKSGDEMARETTYIHILRYQIAEHARETYKRHGLAIGIFSLESTERRNCESKYAFVNHNNGKGNFCLQTLKRNTRKFDVLTPKPPAKKQKKK